MAKLALKKDYVDGTILYATELNINNGQVEAAVNDNADKIQAFYDGSKSVKNSELLNGAGLSTSEEEIQDSDLLISTSKQVKDYVDAVKDRTTLLESTVDTHNYQIEELVTDVALISEAKIPAGGLAGYVLIKNTDLDYDFVWASGGGAGTTTVIDALTSTLSSAALSANMGRVLNENKAELSYVNSELMSKASIADLNNGLSTKANTEDVNSALALKANSADVTTALSGKVDTTTLANYSTSTTISNDYLSKAGNLLGLTNLATARTNLGLGSMSTRNVTVSTASPTGGSSGDIWIKYV